jgi:hypothetical protein
MFDSAVTEQRRKPPVERSVPLVVAADVVDGDGIRAVEFDPMFGEHHPVERVRSDQASDRPVMIAPVAMAIAFDPDDCGEVFELVRDPPETQQRHGDAVVDGRQGRSLRTGEELVLAATTRLDVAPIQPHGLGRGSCETDIDQVWIEVASGHFEHDVVDAAVRSVEEERCTGDRDVEADGAQHRGEGSVRPESPVARSGLGVACHLVSEDPGL